MIWFTVAMIAALAGALTFAVYRSLFVDESELKFDEALAIIQASELDDYTTNADSTETPVDTSKWSWSRFWRELALQAGRTPDDPSSPGRFAAGGAVLASLFGYLVFPGGMLGLVLGGPVALGVGYAWLTLEIGKRNALIETQMPLLLTTLRSQMHAGVTVQAALMNIADDLPSPIGDEVRKVRQDVNVSIPLDQALDALSVRVSSRQMQFLVSSIGIAVKSGADLVPQLITIEEIVRQRARIEGKINSALALAKPTIFLAVGAPIAVFVYYSATNPDYLPYFFGEGFLFGLVAVSMIAGGVFAIYTMIKGVQKT